MGNCFTLCFEWPLSCSTTTLSPLLLSFLALYHHVKSKFCSPQACCCSIHAGRSWQRPLLIALVVYCSQYTDIPRCVCTSCPYTFATVQPTGGGKSATRACIGFILGGVVLTIGPLLSLGADPSSKLKESISSRQLPRHVLHLDKFKTKSLNLRLQNICFLAMDKDSDHTIPW